MSKFLRSIVFLKWEVLSCALWWIYGLWLSFETERQDLWRRIRKRAICIKYTCDFSIYNRVNRNIHSGIFCVLFLDFSTLDFSPKIYNLFNIFIYGLVFLQPLVVKHEITVHLTTLHWHWQRVSQTGIILVLWPPNCTSLYSSACGHGSFCDF